MTAWLTRPAPYAAGALLLSVVWIAVWEGRSWHWGERPLARWDLSSEEGFWLRDPDDQWIIFPELDVPSSNVSGLGFSFDAIGGDVALDVLWRRAGEATEYSKTVTHSLSRSWGYVDLSEEPEWIGQIDALGIRSLHGGPMQVTAVTLEVPGVWAGLVRAWRSFLVTELFDQSAVNFRDGTKILTVNFSTALAVVVLVFLSIKVAQAARSRPLDWRSVCALALAAWVLLDLRFTYDLIANARVDRARYPSFGAADAVVSTDPYPPFAELVAAVEAHVPRHARIAFITDHWTYLIKGPYVFFPRRVVKSTNNLTRQADYVVVFLKEQISYIDRSQQLTLDGRKTPAKRIAQIEDVGAIYEVIEPNRGVRPRAGQ